jgi:hypothetical protein
MFEAKPPGISLIFYLSALASRTYHILYIKYIYLKKKKKNTTLSTNMLCINSHLFGMHKKLYIYILMKSKIYIGIIM